MKLTKLEQKTIMAGTGVTTTHCEGTTDLKGWIFGADADTAEYGDYYSTC